LNSCCADRRYRRPAFAFRPTFSLQLPPHLGGAALCLALGLRRALHPPPDVLIELLADPRIGTAREDYLAGATTDPRPVGSVLAVLANALLTIEPLALLQPNAIQRAFLATERAVAVAPIAQVAGNAARLDRVGLVRHALMAGM
jgi:hypothetical protein